MVQYDKDEGTAALDHRVPFSRLMAFDFYDIGYQAGYVMHIYIAGTRLKCAYPCQTYFLLNIY